jgi:hypothetical protein
VDEWIKQHAIESVLGIVVALLAFFGKREIKRIDEKADQEDVEALLKRMDEHIQDDKELRKDLRESMDRFAERLTETSEHVAHIRGKLGV